MTEPTQKDIERTVRIVAEALKLVIRDTPNGMHIAASETAKVSVPPSVFLSDHRTVARYFTWVKAESGLADSDIEELLLDAWANPLPAIIALVASVEGEA